MTASATRTSLPTSDCLDGYSNFVNRLAANKPHTDLVPAQVARELIRLALDDSELVDQAKKALFYGKDKPEIGHFRNGFSERARSLPYPDDQLADGLKRLHTALGIRSEADEILRQELARLQGDTPSIAEETDELGDLLWYAQLRARLLGKSLIDVIRDNVAKLEKRFPDGAFSEAHAQNPDKAAEAAEQAKVA